MSDNMRDLTKLVYPFPQRFIKSNPSGGGTYVRHSVVTQRLLDVLGPVDFELVRVIHGFVPGIAPNPDGNSKRAKQGMPELTDAVVGVVMRMRATIDDRVVTIEEVGDCEDPHNWPHDGARLKDAMSDAWKRCATRVGVGLHLWAQEDFYLFDKLRAQDGGAEPPEPEPAVAPEAAVSEPQGDAGPAPEPTTAPPAQNGSQPPEPGDDEAVWMNLASEAGMTRAQLLKAARNICKNHDQPEPVKIGDIPDDVGVATALIDFIEAKKAGTA